ncbi:Microtubule-associated protein TORTIFOLIA1-like protein [Drosera capensis]
MGSHGPKSSSKPRNNSAQLNPKPSNSTLTSHLAMVELKQRILNSLSKLSDRDTYQIGIEELESLIDSLQNDAVPMLINCLFDASSSDPKPAAKKESIRLLGVLCGSHADSASTHLVKIVAHLGKRLRDSDPGVRDACRDVVGTLAGIYVKGESEDGNGNGVVSLFVKPLFEAMGESSKGVQVGAALCLGKVVDCAKNKPVSAFQKLCPRICKYLNNPNFFARSALLPLVSSLSQVGAIAPQSLEPLLQSIHDCLASTDWATRKAAADTLIALAMHSRDLIKDSTTLTVTVLEGCRFDKIKPVRDSITEALQLWKGITEKPGDDALDEQKASSRAAEKSGSNQFLEKSHKQATDTTHTKMASLAKESSNTDSTVPNSDGKSTGVSVSDKAVQILKKKVPGLTDKDLNPEFFQKLEKGCADLPVEVVVPRKPPAESNSREDMAEHDQADNRGNTNSANLPPKPREFEGFGRDRLVDPKGFNGKDQRPRALDNNESNVTLFKADSQSEGAFMGNKANWQPIQRQLLRLERQQSHLMKMLQDFMAGSHDSMLTLENRVRALERVVEDMAQDWLGSSGRGNFMSRFEGSSNRQMGRYRGLFDYSAKPGRGGGGRIGDGFPAFGGGSRGRAPQLRSESPDNWDFHNYDSVKNGHMGARRDVGSNHMGSRSPHSDCDDDHISSRRAWDKGARPVRLGEGPSARSVWQSSKDEATLEAIRVAGDDNGTTRSARAAVPEMIAEAEGNDNSQQDQDPVWTCWRNAMDAVEVGDMDSAYAEVLSTGDDFLLVKLMDRSGPVLDHLSDEIAVEILNAVLQLVLEQNLFDICLSWVQQLAEIVLDNGTEVFGIPMDIKRELLFNLHEASATIELPKDWEGATPEQLMLQLASSWGINLQHHTGE